MAVGPGETETSAYSLHVCNSVYKLMWLLEKKIIGQLFQKLEREVVCDPGIPVLGIYTKELKSVRQAV